MFLKGIYPILWIVAVGFSVYAITLSFNLVHLDDSRYVLDHYSFNSNFSNIFVAFRQNINHPSGESAYYRPIQAITHIIDAHIGGTNPFFYHLTNIILHLIASSVLFLFLLQILLKRSLTFFLALLFTVHPTLTGAVAWIPGRIDLLLTIFILLSAIFFLQYRNKKTVGYFIAHILCFAIALFTKELTVVFPFILLVYLFAIREKIFSSFHAPFFAGWSAVFLVWYFLSESAIGNVRSLSILGITKVLLVNFKAIFLYVGKMLFPFNLAALPTLDDSTIIYGVAAILIMLTGLYLSTHTRWRFVLFGATWLFLFLVPSFYTDDPTSVPIFMEHRAYIPLIGFLLIFAEIDTVKNLNFSTYRSKIASLTIIILFALLTINHSMHFKNRESFWVHAVETSPHLPKAHHGLGTNYLVSGTSAMAEAEYKKAIELNPNEWFVHGNLGLLYMQDGFFDAAEEEYQRELDVNPANTNTLLNLGILYYRDEQRFEEAKAIWEKAIAINPHLVDAHEYLAIYSYEHEQDIEKTIYHINEVLKREGKVQQGLQEIYDMIDTWKP